MDKISFNGKISNINDAALFQNNRAFHYGDGVFESIKVINGKAVFVNNHFIRLSEGLKALQINIPEHLNAESLRNEINLLLEANKIKEGGRVRLTAYRNAEGFYTPRGNDLNYLIETRTYDFNEYILNREGLIVDTYNDIKKQITPLSTFKTLNCQLYIMAGIYALNKDLDDCLIMNGRGNIIESTNSNLFIVSNGILYTPSLADGCLGGTMRMNVINLALENNIKIYECTLTPQHLLAADEVFLSNAIKGVQWVSSYRMKRYFHKLADFFIQKLNQTVHSN